MKCRSCQSKMQRQSFGDIAGFLSAGYCFYCNNKDCPRYGDLTRVGILDADQEDAAAQEPAQ